MDLAIAATMDGPYTIVRVDGEVGYATAHLLKTRLCDLMEYKRRRFIIDLSGAVFTDYTVVAALVAVVIRIRELKGLIRLVASEGPARDFVVRTGLGSVIPLFDSVQEAMAAGAKL